MLLCEENAEKKKKRKCLKREREWEENYSY
jgi:hypothetical protein